MERNRLGKGCRNCRPSGLNGNRRGRNRKGRHWRSLGNRKSWGNQGRRKGSCRYRLRECVVTRRASVECHSIIIVIVEAVGKEETWQESNQDWLENKPKVVDDQRDSMGELRGRYRGGVQDYLKLEIMKLMSGCKDVLER